MFCVAAVDTRASGGEWWRVVVIAPAMIAPAIIAIAIAIAIAIV
jgi:hypothetical protein